VNGDGTIDVGDLVNVATRVPSELSQGEPGAFDNLDAVFQALAPTLRPGDANRDFQFDQPDVLQVLKAGKYLTGAPADWSEGDWNGDGVFDQLDIVATLQTGNYLQGPHAARAGAASALAKAENQHVSEAVEDLFAAMGE